MVAVAPFRPTILPLSRRKVSSQSACRRKEQVDEVWLKRRRGSWCAEYCGRLGEPAQHGSILAAVPRIAFGRSLGGRVRAFGSQVHIGAAHRTPTVRSRGCCSRGHIVLAARTHGKGEVHSNAHELATWMLCAGKAELLHPRTWVRAAGRHFAGTCAQLCRAFTPRDEITESAALTAPAAATCTGATENVGHPVSRAVSGRSHVPPLQAGRRPPTTALWRARTGWRIPKGGRSTQQGIYKI
mmetsp:Transcript_4984/g.16473  ORF Transcript_4984/g.16473 Transcript_4984/m.16473 type:complete len:241 (-) Transcript_4984:8-730(-)